MAAHSRPGCRDLAAVFLWGGSMLAGKRIVVGVTGSIAAFKSAQLVSNLCALGAEVRVIMTKSAQKFVNPLTFRVLSGNHVYTGMFDYSAAGKVQHIDLAAEADLLVIAPATANIIGKAASGIADDLLSTVIMAAACPVLFCPAMNVNMYENRIVRRNIDLLSAYGYHFVEPASGRLACGAEGRGRLADLELIIKKIEELLIRRTDLKDITVLVTAGPTVEPLDPVRYLTNRSSGKMGYAVCEAALERGAKVVLVSGPVSLAPPKGAEVVRVETAQEMYKAVLEHFDSAGIVVKAAAVADYRPKEVSASKIKKKDGPMTVELVRNPDILAELGKRKCAQVLVGFAAETCDLLVNARQKLKDKNLDLLVANDVTVPGAGFGTDTNIASLVFAGGEVLHLPQMEKKSLAHIILDEAIKIYKARHGRS